MRKPQIRRECKGLWTFRVWNSSGIVVTIIQSVSFEMILALARNYFREQRVRDESTK